LEACCAEMGEWQSLNNCYGSELAEDLRTARRPKPPSLKEQALDGLRNIEANIPQSLRAFESSCDTIRRALEALPD
jgi:hypothetical protein